MNNTDQLKKKIEEWLLSQGYPLEMRVAALCRDSGFNVIQGHYYSDPETGTAREIDVIASHPDYTGCIDVSFVIECKVSKKNPWLLFSSQYALEGFNRLFAYCINSQSARKVLVEKDIETFLSLPWMKKDGRTAYGITQAFTSGDDQTFKAATSVLKAAIARKLSLDSQRWKPFLFIFPVIIMDGPLFECFLNKDGQLSIEPFEDGFFFFPWNVLGEAGTCIRILSLNSLTRFITEAKTVGDSLTSLLKKDIEEKLRTI